MADIECSCGRSSPDIESQMEHLLVDHNMQDWEREQAMYKLQSIQANTEQ